MEFSKFYLISIILIISVYESSPSLHPLVRRVGSRCSSYPATKNAGLRCVMNGSQKCYAICLAGHVLQHSQQKTKTAVTCRNGHWSPRTTKCVVSNACRLKLVDAGEVTCKASMNSYKCLITCYSERSMSTYSCNSKTKTWFPHLPKCAKPKSYSSDFWTEEANRHIGKIVHYKPGGSGHHQPGRSEYFQPGGHIIRPKIRPGKKRIIIIQKKIPEKAKMGPIIVHYQPGQNDNNQQGRAGHFQPGGNGHHQPGKSGYFIPGGHGRPGRIVYYPQGHPNRPIIRPRNKGPIIIQKKIPEKAKMGPRKVYDFEFTVE